MYVLGSSDSRNQNLVANFQSTVIFSILPLLSYYD